MHPPSNDGSKSDCNNNGKENARDDGSSIRTRSRRSDHKSGSCCHIRSRLFHKLGITRHHPSTHASPKITINSLRSRSLSCTSLDSASTVSTACSSASSSLATKKPTSHRRLLERSVTTHQPLKPGSLAPRGGLLGMFHSSMQNQHHENTQLHFNEFPADVSPLMLQQYIHPPQQSPCTPDTLPLVSPNGSIESSKSNTSTVRFDTTVTVTSIPSRTQYSKRIKKFLWTDRKEISNNARRNAIEFAADGWDWQRCVEEHEMYYDVCNSVYIHPVHVDEREFYVVR